MLMVENFFWRGLIQRFCCILNLENNKSLINIKSIKTEQVKTKLYNRRLLERISRLNEGSKIYKHTEVSSPNELTKRSHVSASIPIIKLRKQDFKESDPKIRENLMFSKYIERKFISNRRCSSGIRIQSKRHSNEYSCLMSPTKLKQIKGKKSECIAIDSDEENDDDAKVLDKIQLQIVEVSQVYFLFSILISLQFSLVYISLIQIKSMMRIMEKIKESKLSLYLK